MNNEQTYRNGVVGPGGGGALAVCRLTLHAGSATKGYILSRASEVGSQTNRPGSDKPRWCDNCFGTLF